RVVCLHVLPDRGGRCGWISLLHQLASPFIATKVPRSRGAREARIYGACRRDCQSDPGSWHGVDEPASLHFAAVREGAMRVITGTALLFMAAAVVVSGCTGGQYKRPYQLGVNGDPHAGKVLIENYGCGSCHTIPGIYTARGVVGPPLY